jgi:SulP family sulfate permease
VEDGRDLHFDRKDFAVEYLENRVLRNTEEAPGHRSIRDLLDTMIVAQDKVEILLQAMQRVDCKAGETLFKKGDPDSGLYILEKGSLSAYITNASGQRIRVKKFSPGSLVGELSAYLVDKFRTATVVADEDSTVYHLDTERLQKLGSENHELRACIHELVATTLAERVSFMNNRLAAESS